MFKIGMDRVWCPTLPHCGHIISGDNIVNLKSLLDSGEVKSGERILMLMAGYGMNWQCTIAEAV
jgi:3-oxoacyl-[acyl-carrier-protein] synthase-3